MLLDDIVSKLFWMQLDLEIANRVLRLAHHFRNPIT